MDWKSLHRKAERGQRQLKEYKTWFIPHTHMQWQLIRRSVTNFTSCVNFPACSVFIAVKFYCSDWHTTEHDFKGLGHCIQRSSWFKSGDCSTPDSPACCLPKPYSFPSTRGKHGNHMTAGIPTMASLNSGGDTSWEHVQTQLNATEEKGVQHARAILGTQAIMLSSAHVHWSWL